MTDLDGVRWFVDPYLEWVEREGLPVTEGLAVDLTELETVPWPRMGANGAFVHLDGRGDYISVYVLEVQPGEATELQQHLYESVTYVLDGHGSTVIEVDGGNNQTFEWAEGSIFAIPLNARYRYFNGDGNRPVRLAVMTNLPVVMKLFRNEKFVFGTPFEFDDRQAGPDYFGGVGNLIRTYEHRHMWETNLVPDLLSFDELQDSPSRGHGSRNVHFILADATMHAHVSEIPPGKYKKAHKHPADFHIIQLSGAGYSLYWEEGQSFDEALRVDWKHGMLHAPSDMIFHQHFNVSDEPARYMAAAFGSLRYPFSAAKWAQWERRPTQKSQYQIEYEDQDPHVDRLFEQERAKFRAAKDEQASA